MKLLLDEMWSPQAAVQLRERGHNVVAVLERTDLQGMNDILLFDVAQEEQRTLVTENVGDFRIVAMTAIEQGHHHHGLIFTTNSRFPRRDDRTIGRLVIALHEILTSNLDCMDREIWLS